MFFFSLIQQQHIFFLKEALTKVLKSVLTVPVALISSIITAPAFLVLKIICYREQ